MKSTEVRTGPKIRPNRMKVCSSMPCEEELAAIKHKKKVCDIAMDTVTLTYNYGLFNKNMSATAFQ